MGPCPLGISLHCRYLNPTQQPPDNDLVRARFDLTFYPLDHELKK